ncbi:MAG: tRNA (adenosine(37)-N6)-threonylcarbamoyltransferase complex ATPase subunit type 1 TsaE [Deltaproteobacteria bacterium]|nr:tRNA (adenosine(37)-N6)-threonylcarbamoyltransferase complex ATPase subunit type 1 TsaE [Deltaproteobacteria bacterium]
MELEIHVNNEEQTKRFAENLAKTLPGGVNIGLIGELGAGKTTFTRHLVAALGIDAPVSSPTYVLEHQYDGKFLVHHWDLYRLSFAPEDLFEPVSEAEIRLIEWADKFESLLSDLDLLISFHYVLDQLKMRTIKLSGKILADIRQSIEKWD